MNTEPASNETEYEVLKKQLKAEWLASAPSLTKEEAKALVYRLEDCGTCPEERPKEDCMKCASYCEAGQVKLRAISEGKPATKVSVEDITALVQDNRICKNGCSYWDKDASACFFQGSVGVNSSICQLATAIIEKIKGSV